MTPAEFRAYLEQCPIDRVKRLLVSRSDGQTTVELELTSAVADRQEPAPVAEEWPGLTDLGVRVPQRG